jgi:hypothetical protein
MGFSSIQFYEEDDSREYKLTARLGMAWQRHKITTFTHLYIFILQRLYVETDRRNRLDRLVGFVLQPVENSGLSGVVQTQNQDSNLFGAKEGLEHFAEHNPHDCSLLRIFIALLLYCTSSQQISPC